MSKSNDQVTFFPNGQLIYKHQIFNSYQDFLEVLDELKRFYNITHTHVRTTTNTKTDKEYYRFKCFNEQVFCPLEIRLVLCENTGTCRITNYIEKQTDHKIVKRHCEANDQIKADDHIKVEDQAKVISVPKNQIIYKSQEFNTYQQFLDVFMELEKSYNIDKTIATNTSDEKNDKEYLGFRCFQQKKKGPPSIEIRVIWSTRTDRCVISRYINRIEEMVHCVNDNENKSQSLMQVNNQSQIEDTFGADEHILHDNNEHNTEPVLENNYDIEDQYAIEQNESHFFNQYNENQLELSPLEHKQPQIEAFHLSSIIERREIKEELMSWAPEPSTTKNRNPITTETAKSILELIDSNASEQQKDIFEYRLEQILLIKHLWETNVDFVVTPLNADNINQFTVRSSTAPKRKLDKSDHAQSGKKTRYSFDLETSMLSPKSDYHN